MYAVNDDDTINTDPTVSPSVAGECFNNNTVCR